MVEVEGLVRLSAIQGGWGTHRAGFPEGEWRASAPGSAAWNGPRGAD